MYGAVGDGWPYVIDESRCDVKEPKTFLGRLHPEGGANRIAVSGEALDKTASVTYLVNYQRALIHGNTSFSIASNSVTASASTRPIS